MRVRKGETVTLYRPLDETLAEPRVRILRALRYHDWVPSIDLTTALGLNKGKVMNTYHQTLKRLADKGLIERRHIYTVYNTDNGHNYRITPAGRAELAKILREYDQVTAWSDRDAEEQLA